MKCCGYTWVLIALSMFMGVACTTDSDDDDGMKGSVVYSKMVGDKTNGFSCEVSKSESSAYMRIQQFINGSYYLVNNEYRYTSNGDGSYTVKIYTDFEFKDFPKSEAVSLCKNYLTEADDDGFADCDANGGHVEQIQTKYAKPLSDEVIEDMEKKCKSNLEAYTKDVDLNDENPDDDDYRDENKESPQFQTGMAILEKGEKLSQRVCGASNVGEMLFVMDSAAAFLCDGDGWHRFDEEKGEGKDDEGNASEPNNTSEGDDFSCDVSQENGKVYQRMSMNEYGLSMNVELVYEQVGSEWLISSHIVYDGLGAASAAKDECSEYQMEYSPMIAKGEMTLECGEKSLDWSVPVEETGISVGQLMKTLQGECDEMKSDYNGVDFDGPREAPSDIPTSCKVTEGESSLTLNVSFSDWAYSSTIQINGSVSHEEELFSGNYGDMAEKMCLSDKSNPDNESVVCDGEKITIDGKWDELLTLTEMKSLSDYMCAALLDGSLSFEEMMFEE